MHEFVELVDLVDYEHIQRVAVWIHFVGLFARYVGQGGAVFLLQHVVVVEMVIFLLRSALAAGYGECHLHNGEVRCACEQACRYSVHRGLEVFGRQYIVAVLLYIVGLVISVRVYHYLNRGYVGVSSLQCGDALFVLTELAIP